MPIRIIKLCIIIAIVGIAIYFVSINSTPTTITVGSEKNITASVGSIVLSSFALGLLLSFLAASLFAIRSFFREQGFKQREKKRVQLQQTLIELQQLRRSADSKYVEKKYQRLVQTYPQELLAHLEYIRFLVDTEKRYGDALKHIVEVKKDFDSSELHYITAECHEQLGNTSSALEALSLILILPGEQNPETIRKAAYLSYSLNRFEDSIEYLNRLNAPHTDLISDKQLRADATASIIIRDELDSEIRLQKLTDFLHRHDLSAVAFTEAARLQQQFQLYNDAAESLMRKFRLTGDINSVRAARSSWLQERNSKAAVSAITSWIRIAKTPSEKNTAEIELAKTYILLGQDDEASKILTGITSSEGAIAELSTDIRKEIAILNAMIAYRGRDAGAAQRAFAEVEQLEFADSSISGGSHLSAPATNRGFLPIQ